jgi:glycosyl hydrolase family 26
MSPLKARNLAAALLCAGMAATAGCAGSSNGDDVPPPDEVHANAREFGIATDPWQLDEWAEAVGAKPTMVMEFEQWSRFRTLDTHFAEARGQGLTSFMVTWEPWEPVQASLGDDARYAEQPAYSNATIATGGLDAYIRDFARSVADSGLTVYIRYAHEMNGDWFPWSRDPDNYIVAWRRIVDIFRSVGAANARFVFSVNPSLFQADEDWLSTAERYWPGDDYVDVVGTTMINFGGDRAYSVADLAERIVLAHETFGMDIMITELNTAAEGRVEWFTDLRTWLATEAPWVVGVVLSQARSQGQILFGGTAGDLLWNVIDDPATQPVVKGMIEDFARS